MLSRLRFKLHSVYDTGVEVQEDQRDNDGGLHYAELSQQESAAHKVRMGAEPSLGSSGSISWVCNIVFRLMALKNKSSNSEILKMALLKDTMA